MPRSGGERLRNTWSQSLPLVRAVTGMLLMLRSKDCRVLRTSEFCGDVKKRITSCLLCNTASSCVGRRNHWLRKGKPSLKLLLSSKGYKHATLHFSIHIIFYAWCKAPWISFLLFDKLALNFLSISYRTSRSFSSLLHTFGTSFLKHGGRHRICYLDTEAL